MASTTKDRTTTWESTEETANNENVYKHRMKIMSNSKDIFIFYIVIIGILVIGALFIWVLSDSSTSQTVYNSSSEITETTTDSGVTPVETELISIVITAIIACISGTFVFFQFKILKKRDKIKCICSYYSVKRTLIDNFRNIEIYIEDSNNTDEQYIGALAIEWHIGEKVWKDIDDLEQLLFECGKRNNDDYTRETIEITSKMKVLAHKINLTYNILSANCSYYKTEDTYNKLKNVCDDFEEFADKYEKKYIRGKRFKCLKNNKN